MAAHQAGRDLEILLFGGLAGAEDLLHAARIGGEVLLHEHVDALFDCVLKMGCAKAGVCGEHGDIARLQAVDRMAVGVEAHELPFLGDVDLVAEQIGRALLPQRNLIGDQVGHRHEFYRASGGRAIRFAAQDESARRHGIGDRPAPRPPQPIKARRIVLSSAAKTRGIATPAKADAAAIPGRLLMKSRRVVPCCDGLFMFGVSPGVKKERISRRPAMDPF